MGHGGGSIGTEGGVSGNKRKDIAAISVEEIGGSGNSLSPKVRRKRSGNLQRTGRLKEVMMLALSHAIPSMNMSTRTRELSKSALLSKKRAQ
jgi:hypothetical protein